MKRKAIYVCICLAPFSLTGDALYLTQVKHLQRRVCSSKSGIWEFFIMEAEGK